VLVDYVRRPEVQDTLQGIALEPLSSTPDELAKFVPAEMTKWGQVLRQAGIAPE
jgi:tripartite-type tricarboxylate transporter receptor subunit TctC